MRHYHARERGLSWSLQLLALVGCCALGAVALASIVIAAWPALVIAAVVLGCLYALSRGALACFLAGIAILLLIILR